MSFLAPLGGLFGLGIAALTGKKKKPRQALKPVTRDDAALEAERADELARRRGARSDRTDGGGGEPAGGLGRLVVGS